MADGSYQVPIVVLHLNLQPPTSDKPTLLTFGKLSFFLISLKIEPIYRVISKIRRIYCDLF
jgi:hypothetical protein